MISVYEANRISLVLYLIVKLFHQYEFVNGESNNLNTSGGQPRILEGALPPLPLLDPLHYHYIAPHEPKFNCTR